MKKINPEKDFCEQYRRGDVPHTLKTKICISCFYSLFAKCWFEEAQNNERLVISALEGNPEARRQLHKKLLGEAET